MAITSAQQTEILKIVAGLFNAAPGGTNLTELANLVQGGMTTSQLADALAAHTLFTGSIMAGKVTTSSQVNVLMNNFGFTADSDPASAGSQAQAYFTQKIDGGVGFGKIVYDAVQFLSGSVPPEFTTAATLLSNKALVSAAYSESNSSANLTTLQAIISSVTGTAAYTDADVAGILDAATGGGNVGQTFTLTTGTNNFTGGGGDDTFEAGLNTSSQQTLNSGDRLDGSTGTDYLIATINGSVTPASIKSVEDVTVTVITNSATIDFTNATGITALTSQASSGAGNTVTLQGIGASVGVAIKDTSMAHTITYSDVTGSSDSATVSVSNVSQATGIVTSILGVETLTLNATGSASSGSTTGIGTLTATQTTKLNVTGDKALNIVDNLESNIVTVDASKTSAGVNLDFGGTNMVVTGGSGNDDFSFEVAGDVSVVGGAGNDTFRFDATGTLTTADTVTGGDGTDTLNATSANLVTVSASTPTTYKITGVETITANTAVANAATITLGNISTTANRLNLTEANAGTSTFAFSAGDNTLSNAKATVGGITVSAAGTGVSDTLTIVHGAASSVDSLNGQSLTSTGFETVTINTTGTGAAGTQTVGAVSVTATGTATSKLVVTGSNQLTTGVVTVSQIDASGMTKSAGSTGLDMVTGANTATSVTGSAADDDLWGNITTATNATITAGAGNDTITAGDGNDVLTGGDGDDVINGAAGNDSIDGGAGNDRVIIAADANLTTADTIVGGDGTDIVSFTANMTDDASTFARISGFEVLRHNTADTITMSNFINNQGFTRIEVDGAAAITFNNASSNVTTLQINATGSTSTVDRLIDDATNAITVSIESGDGASAATLVLQDEETITFANALATDDFTVTALTSTDAKSVIVTGAGDLISSTAVTSGTAIATVDASAATGAVTFNAGNSTTKVTATAGSGVFTFTGGILGDAITGGLSADALTGGAGADTISGAVGADTITGGAGADSMTGGAGADTFVQTALTNSAAYTASSIAGATIAAGDTFTFGNGVDIITDFTAGTGGDVLDNGAAAVVANATGIGQNKTTGFATATTTYWVSGTYSSGTFTALADGTGADTLIVFGDATPTALSSRTDFVVLVGVDTDNLVAANFS